MGPSWNGRIWIMSRRRIASWWRLRPCAYASSSIRCAQIKSFEEFASQCEYFVDVAVGLQLRFYAFPGDAYHAVALVHPGRSPSEAVRELIRVHAGLLESLHAVLPSNTMSTSSAGRISPSRRTLLYNIAYLFRRDGTLGKQYKLHITPSERQWWGVQAGRAHRGLRHRPGQDRDSDLLRHRVSGADADRRRAGGADHLRALLHRRAYAYLRVRYCCPGTVHREPRLRRDRRERRQPADSSTTWTSTTRSQAYSRPPTSLLSRDAIAASARRISRRSSSRTSTSNC